MSRFEQRREMGPREMLAQKKVKVPTDHNVVYLQNTGNEGDLLGQKHLYWQEGFDEFHKDDSGIYMAIPKAEATRNESRYQLEAADRMKRPSAAGLESRYSEATATLDMKPMTAEDFLAGKGDEE